MNTLLFVEKGAASMFREQPIAKQMAWYESVLSGTGRLLLKNLFETDMPNNTTFQGPLSYQLLCSGISLELFGKNALL